MSDTWHNTWSKPRNCHQASQGSNWDIDFHKGQKIVLCNIWQLCVNWGGGSGEAQDPNVNITSLCLVRLRPNERKKFLGKVRCTLRKCAWSCLSFVSYNDQIVAIGCLGLNESSSSEWRFFCQKWCSMVKRIYNCCHFFH